MPEIPEMNLESNTLDADEIYSGVPFGGGLYKPTNVITAQNTLEVLNGSLSEGNLNTTFKIEPWMCQIGTFARGAYWGSDRWEFVYAKQLSKEANNTVTLNTLSRTLFIPWQPSIIMYGYQGWFRQEATVWDADGGSPRDEEWELAVYLKSGASRIAALKAVLPPGRGSGLGAGTSGTEPPEWTTTIGDYDPGAHQEDRFRWVSKSGMVATSANSLSTAGDPLFVGPGHFSFEVRVSANIYAPNDHDAKLTIPTCSAWVLALR